MQAGAPADLLPLRVFCRFPHRTHAEVLSALEKISDEMKADSDSRIPMQLEDVMSAIRQLLVQIQREKGTTA